ncbi:DMT family transporter [Silvibacterium sp.]|uniref:DMT family transporter n=1 Tax=Silvibacterium sp. TaxID=1964179 RepID=UPI0039E2EDFC
MKPRYLSQLLALSAVWGVSFLMIRIADLSFPPVWVGLLRCATGALFLWIVLIAGRHTLPPRKLFVWLFLVALTNNALPFSFFAWGERVVPSSTAAVINGTTPIWALLLSLAVTRKRASLQTVLGVVLGFAGVALVVMSQTGATGSSTFHNQELFGALVIALGALGYAIATVIAKTKLKGLDPIGLATTQLSLAGITLIPAAFAGPHPGHIHLSSVLAILTLGVAGSGIAYLLYYKLLAHASATQVAAVTYLLPLWGLLWGAIAHEPLSIAEFAGAGVVVLGLALIHRPSPLPRVTPQTCVDRA